MGKDKDTGKTGEAPTDAPKSAQTDAGPAASNGVRHGEKSHVKHEMSKHESAHARFKVFVNKMLDHAVAMAESGATAHEVRVAVDNLRGQLDEAWADIERVAR